MAQHAGATAPSADALVELAPDLWVAERPLQLPVGMLSTRMTVIRLRDGGLFLHSPVRLDEATRNALNALGPVRVVVAPSRAHHMFVGDYFAAYPQAQVYAAPGLQEKRKDVSFHGVLDDTSETPWRSEIDYHLFKGAPFLNEVVFFHRASRSILFTDLVFNVAAGRTQGARIFYFLSGAPGHFGPHRFIRAAIRDRHAARQSVEHILRWDFDRVIVTHGDVMESDGYEAVAGAFAYLL